MTGQDVAALLAEVPAADLGWRKLVHRLYQMDEKELSESIWGDIRKELDGCAARLSDHALKASKIAAGVLAVEARAGGRVPVGF